MDAPADISAPFDRDSLFQHQSFVRSLAQRLARDEHEAEELEQDAWVVALERRPERLRDPRAWLARVVRTRARTRRRGDARRRLHEARGARDEATRGHEELDAMAARLALAQSVVAAALELDDPYRRVVLLRHFRGLGPAQIAAELGVPVETARTRLRRAHETLRERLDRQAGGRERWAPALLAWARELGERTNTTVATSAAVGLGGMIMVAGTTALVAVAIGFGLWQRSADRDASADGGIEAQVADAEAASRSTPDESAATRARAQDSSTAPAREQVARPPAPGWWLVGGVEGAASSEKPARVSLRDARGRELMTTEVPAARFELALNALAPQLADSIALELEYDHPDSLPGSIWLALPDSFVLNAGERRELRADLEPKPPAGFVQGVVEAPAATNGLVVALFELDADGKPEPSAVESATLRSGEPFRLRARRLGAHVLVAQSHRARELTIDASATLLAPATRQVAVLESAGSWESLSLDPGETLAGRALDAAGAPLAEHVVTIQPNGAGRPYLGHEQPLVWKDGRFQNASVKAVTGGDGAFAVAGLCAGEHSIDFGGRLREEGDGAIPRVSGVEARRVVRAPASDVELRRAVRTRLLVVTCNGRPVADAEVRLASGGVHVGGAAHAVGFGGKDVVPREIGERDPSVASTDALGRVQVVTADGEPPVLFVSKDGYAPGFVMPPPGEDAGDELRLELRAHDADSRLSFALPANALRPGLELWVELQRIDPDEAGAGDRPKAANDQPASRGLVSIEMSSLGPGGEVQVDQAQRICQVAPDGRAEVGGFAAGRYAVHVVPRLERGAGPPPLLLPRRFELELVEGVDETRALELEQAAGLELFVAEEAGALALRVLDAAEQPVDVRFASMAGRLVLGAGKPLAAGPYEAWPALVPGEYTLVIGRGEGEVARKTMTLPGGVRTRVRLDAVEVATPR